MSDINWQATVPSWLSSAFLRGILITDIDMRIRFWNDWLETHTGTPAAEAVGCPLRDLYPDLTERGLLRHYERALVGETSRLSHNAYGYLLPMPAPGRPDLTQMPQDAQIGPLRADGCVIGTISTIEDCTGHDELRQEDTAKSFLADLSAELAKSLDYGATVQRLAQITVPTLADWCLIDICCEGERLAAIAHVDPARARLAEDRYRTQRLQRHQDEQPHMPEQPLLITRVTLAALSLISTDLETLELLRDLEPESCIAVPLKSGGAQIGTMLLARNSARPAYSLGDLALAEEIARRAAMALENVRLYAAAQHARALAEEAVRVRDAFFSIAAHELRTPLTTLLGRAQMLQRLIAQRDEPDERSQRTIQIVVAQSQRLNKMITALLDVSRIQTGRFSIDPAPMNLTTLVRRVVDESRLMIADHPIRFQSPEAPLMIDGDELRLEQMLQNLIGNAVKYSPGGGQVSVILSGGEGRAMIAVADQGIGIAPDAQRQLFQRFYRADSAEAHGISGMGIGLFVVKEIAELHGGEVGVQSDEDKGSTFTVRLPLRQL
ncbi:PAS domain-containing protein [Chloroflexales bacterium ZM16-3]|nr:PAS domain-containing protein [Chloroflexales bacterium ZM16-3]